MSKTLNWQSPAFHRTGPSVTAFRSQVLRTIAPQKAVIKANAHVKSGALLAGAAGSPVAGASVTTALTFDTFQNSFASFKDLNKSTHVTFGVDLEDSTFNDSAVSKSEQIVSVKNIRRVEYQSIDLS